MGSISQAITRLAVMLWLLLAVQGSAVAQTLMPADTLPAAATESAALVQLGPGDTVTLSVYGQPDMTTTEFVGDDGTLAVPLVGPVAVNGLSPTEASRRIEKALRDKKIFVDPHVNISAIQSRSQRVSVLGEVSKPGRYVIESNVAILDLLAEAGGATENAADVIYILRPDRDGKVNRYEIDLKALAAGQGDFQAQAIRPGDSIVVPKAEQFYIYGEVTTPGRFRVEPGMTVVEAIARAGGITPRGSQRRIEMKRLRPDGSYATTRAALNERIQPNDVIKVKESIF